jgi:hypothetical protein
MRYISIKWILTPLLLAALSAVDTVPANAQPRAGFGDRDAMRSQDGRWQHDQQQRDRMARQRQAIGRLLRGSYTAGFFDGYRQAVKDHLPLMLDFQQQRRGTDRTQPQGRPFRPRSGELPRQQGRRGMREGMIGGVSEQHPQIVSGKILRTKRVDLKNTRQQHLVALVQTDQGKRRIVDLGRAQDLAKLDLGRGDRISVRGGTLPASGDVPVVVARQLTVGDNKVTIRKQQKAQWQ